MKTWPQKVNVPKFGVCTVKEAADEECNGQTKLAPVSHGFVNLHRGDEWVGWCGTFLAQRHIISNDH